MSFYFFLNEKLLGTCYYRKIYQSTFEIDVNDMNLMCGMSNKLQFICMYPRMNILKIISFTEFFFNELPLPDYYGKVTTRCNIYFNKDDYDTFPCEIFVRGFQIIRVEIPMPKDSRLFLRELKYIKRKKIKATCCICYEEKNNIVNIHENHYNHFVCSKCIVQIDYCPICRQKIE
jgi:hypothetical protein